jgi:hypothetical protein
MGRGIRIGRRMEIGRTQRSRSCSIEIGRGTQINYIRPMHLREPRRLYRQTRCRLEVPPILGHSLRRVSHVIP